jgi:hypothetical protein
MPDQDRRTQFVKLGQARLVLNGGSTQEYDELIKALGRSLGHEPLGPLMVARKAGGGWVVLGRDRRSCLEVLSCLEEAGITADVAAGARQHPDE